MNDVLALAGRLMLVVLYFADGIGKITGFDGTVQYIAGRGVPLPQLAAIAAILIEAGGGLLVIIGWQTRCAALALAVFTLAITPIFHDYWNLGPPNRLLQYFQFWKNIGLAGGFLLLAAHGAGAWSVDGRGKAD